MSTNCSSSYIIPFSLYLSCLISMPSSIIFFLFNITNVLLHLPLSILILHHGLQQWLQKRSSSSSSAAMSHSDCITYHLVTMELMAVFGCVMNCCVIYWKATEDVLQVSNLLLTFTWFGETFFHAMACLERYLAVIHPITYLSLRSKRGIAVRNISIGCVWLLCTVGTVSILNNQFTIVNFCVLVFSIPVVSVCSLCVLRVLIRPRLGEQGRDKKRCNDSKRRAFYTILAILGVLVVRFTWSLAWSILYMSRGDHDCLMMTIDVWFNLPSSLVLSLLYLLRSGKTVCWKKNIQ